jgi:DNA-binding response OmpR family regulator
MPRILVVSHDRDLLAVASRVLSRAGWDVAAAAHAGHAILACAQGEPFEVLIVEDAMADVPAAHIAARLRRYCPDVRLVWMCDRPSSHGEGIAVVRPFTADDLIGAVEAAAAIPTP